MKRIIGIIAAIVLVAGAAFASVNVMSDGTNLGPAQEINFTGGTVSGNGPVKTVDLTTITDGLDIAGAVTVDGTIYTGTLTVDGAIYAGQATVDPCATLGVGYIFFNSSGEPCYCNEAKADVKIFDGSTACF